MGLGLIDPEFDTTEYQTAENVEDVFVYPDPPEPNIVGYSRDNFDTATPCEIKYAKGLRLISETEMSNYRKVSKAQMSV